LNEIKRNANAVTNTQASSDKFKKRFTFMSLAIKLAESGKLPDALVRKGIRQLTEKRLKEIYAYDCEVTMAHLMQFIAQMNASPQIAPLPELANAQHYEVPEQFFHYCLGMPICKMVSTF
jgi:cyclopropane-fatty-acyl-phospholipid synthase